MQNPSSSLLPTRQPPHDMEAERAVLACLMLEDNTYDKLMGVIDVNDFYSPNNGLIFAAVKSLFEAGEPYDLTMVAAVLRSAGNLERVGGVDYLTSLVMDIPNAAHVQRYANIVKNKSKLRELIRAATSINEIAYDYDQNSTLDSVDAIDQSGQLVLNLAKDGSHKDPQPVANLIGGVYDEIKRLYEVGGDMTGVTSGFMDLDKVTNGLQPGSLVIVAGRPAMGKSSLALNMAQHAASAGKSVVFFSLEMSSTQLMQRVLSFESGVPSTKIQSGKLNDTDWQNLASVGDRLSKMKIFMDDTSSISVMEIRSKCRRLSSNKECGLDLIIIDYLQLMENKNIQSREQQISDISRNLKGLAKELNVPVIALSQLNRSLEARSNKRPMPSDLRESGAIEQDADMILFIYRDEVYNIDTPEKGIAEIIIGKHRAGPTGTIKLGFVSELTKFVNLDRSGLYQG